MVVRNQKGSHKLNYLIKATLLSLVFLLLSCNEKNKENKIIFVPGEFRTIYFENLESKNKENLIESAPKDIKIINHGDITSLTWLTPITESKTTENIQLGNYSFEVAKLQKLSYEIEGSNLFLKDVDCFSALKIQKLQLLLNKQIKTEEIYFYKVTSPLDDNASKVSKEVSKLSCFFTTNLDLYKFNPKLVNSSKSTSKSSGSLFLINRDSWFVPVDGGTKSDFYTHKVHDNWVKIYQDFDNIMLNKNSVYFSLGNTYFIGVDN